MKPADPTGGVIAHPAKDLLPSAAAARPATVLLQAALLAVLVALTAVFHRTSAFATLSVTFVSIFLEALPFMLLGAVIGGAIETFVSKAAILRLVPGGRLPAVLLAAGLGLVFPVCECAIVPVVRRLYAKGLPLGAGIAFLLGGPIVNGLVFFSTAVAYPDDLTVAIFRLTGGYVIAVAMGMLIDCLFTRQSALVESAPALYRDAHGACLPARPAGMLFKTGLALRHAATDFVDISRFLIFGALAASVLQTLVARGALAVFVQSPVLSILIMMLLAVLMSLCSEADAFVAASFRTTLPLAAQMAFMVLGPMLDLKLIAMYFRLFRKRLILFLSAATFAAVFLVMGVMQWFGQ